MSSITSPPKRSKSFKIGYLSIPILLLLESPPAARAADETALVAAGMELGVAPTAAGAVAGASAEAVAGTGFQDEEALGRWAVDRATAPHHGHGFLRRSPATSQVWVRNPALSRNCEASGPSQTVSFVAFRYAFEEREQTS